MTVKTRTKKTTRRQHSPEYREEALAFAEKVGIRETARQIGLHDSQLYSWRSKARAKRDQSDLEQSLAAENAQLKRKLAGQEEKRFIVKKGGCTLRQMLEVKYVFMREHQGSSRVSAMSRVLRVSRSGFYAWRQRRHYPSPRQLCRPQLGEAVKKAFDTAKGRSGSPKLVLDLADAGHPHDRKTSASSMRRQGLRAKAAKKFKATTNSKHNLPVAPNLLQQDFTAAAPNQKYVSDITYLWTEESGLYLAVVIDLYSRLVVGWAVRCT